MQLENEFEVPAPPDEAWALLNDVPRVVPCMPGAQLKEVVDENTFKVTMKVKMGPISLEFATDVTRDESDEAARRTTMTAKAREVRGRGGATASIVSSLEPAAEGTKVTIVTDLQMQGMVASQGRGIVGDVANQLVGRFADCIAGQLQAAPGDGGGSEVGPAAETAQPAAPAHEHHHVEPLKAGGMVLSALFRPILRLFGKKD